MISQLGTAFLFCHALQVTSASSSTPCLLAPYLTGQDLQADAEVCGEMLFSGPCLPGPALGSEIPLVRLGIVSASHLDSCLQASVSWLLGIQIRKMSLE